MIDWEFTNQKFCCLMGFDESRNDGCPLVVQQFAMGNFRQIQLIQLLVSDITAPKFSCEGSTLAAITIITTIWGMVLTGSYNPRQNWGWFMAVYQTVLISADPGLCQGRGGAWDHRRCGTWLSGRKQGTRLSKATTLSATCPSHLHAPAELLHLHAPAICFSGRSRLPFARPQTLQTLPQASKATTLTATTCPCHLFFRGFKTAVCPPSNPPNASNPPAGLQGNNSYSYMSLPSVLQGVQDCRLPGLNPPKRFQPSRRPPRQQLLQLHAPAICFSGGSRLPFARPQTPQTLPTLPQASKATTLTATTCPCHLFFRGFKTAVCPPSNPPNASNPPAGLQGNNSYSYMPLPSVFQGVQDCRLPALKPPKRFRRPPRQQLLQLHAPAICFSGGSRLPFARPQTPQTLPQASKATTLITATQASKATTLTATTCPCHLFFRGFKTAVCPPSNPPNASNPLAGLQGNNSYSYMPLPSVFQGVQDCRLPALKPPKRFRRPPRQQLLQLHAPAICFSGVQDCRLPALKPPKGFRRPPRQQLLQLHAPAICFSGGSRLPFARPQTPQTLPQASKATTLTATCLCHLFFRGFKTAVCPPSNPPNTSNPPAGLQGNNSDS